MGTAGKVLLGAALLLAILGVAALALSELGVHHLPATLTWRSQNVTVFVPIGLMVLVSIIGTIVLNLRSPRERDMDRQPPRLGRPPGGQASPSEHVCGGGGVPSHTCAYLPAPATSHRRQACG